MPDFQRLTKLIVKHTLGKVRAMRLMAAFRLGPLSSLGQLAGAAIDRPELVYNLFRAGAPARRP
jgi:hypothetical protein